MLCKTTNNNLKQLIQVRSEKEYGRKSHGAHLENLENHIRKNIGSTLFKRTQKL